MPLNPVLDGRHWTESVKTLSRVTLLVLASVSGCGLPPSEPLPKVAGVKDPLPSSVCTELPDIRLEARPRLSARGNPTACLTPGAVNRMSVDRGTAEGTFIPSREWLRGRRLPVELVAKSGSVERLEFYEQCEGITFLPDKETYACLMREVAGWRYQPDGLGCPRRYYYDANIAFTLPEGNRPSTLVDGSCGA